MPIYTDNPKFANNYFPEAVFANATEIPNNLSGKFFNSGFFISPEGSYSIFDDIYISKYSRQSQFDILAQATDEMQINKQILCIAGAGDNFHGFKSRAWHALEGNLHISAFFNVNSEVANFNTGFTIIAAISVIETLDMLPEISERAKIKWVNDIMLDRKKVAGVIAKTRIQGMKVSNVIIGIGINVMQKPILKGDIFVKEATCINDEARKEYHAHSIFQFFVDALVANYNLLINSEYTALFNKYKERSELIGQYVKLMEDKPTAELIASGKVTDIGENLELFIENIPYGSGRIMYHQPNL